MDKNDMKQLLLEYQFNTQEHCSREEFLELIPSLMTILNEERSDVFHLALKHMYPAGLTQVPIEDWEQVLLKDSLPAVLRHVTTIMSDFDKEINDVLGEISATDLQTRNILNLIESCDVVLGSINSLLETTLCQYNLVGSKLPSLLLCVPDIMMTVWSHCALNKSKYSSQCQEFGVVLKKLYFSNKLMQTTYLSLLEDKIDFSDSQECEVLEECLEKLSKLASVLLQLDVFSGYAAFRTYCSVASKYAHNLRNTLHVTPAVQAMVKFVTQHLGECRETVTSADPLQSKKNKLFRVFLKLILDLVGKYCGYLRDTHATLIALLVSLYNFNCETEGEMSTITEAAANNLVNLCLQDPYFMSELLRTEDLTPGFINLCVLCMRKCLERQTPHSENNLALIQLVIDSFSRMEANHFVAMLRSDRYKSAVSTLAALSLVLRTSDYILLEVVLLENLLSGHPAVCLFVCDVWTILLSSGPKALFESTCVFLVETVNAWDRAVDNAQYRTLMHLVMRCLRDVKPGTAKKMFASGTLSYNQYPVLLTIAPEYLSSKPPSNTLSVPVNLSIHSSSPANDLLKSLLAQPQLDVSFLIHTLTSIHWEDPCTDYIVQTLCSCIQAKLVTFDPTSITQLFQVIVNILSSSSESHFWLSLLAILGSIPAPVCLDAQTSELLFVTLLSRANEDETDYVNKAIATYIGAAVSYLDKSVFLRVLKKSGKIALVTKYVSDHDPYENLNELGIAVQMQCACSQANTEDTKSLENKPVAENSNDRGHVQEMSSNRSKPTDLDVENFDNKSHVLCDVPESPGEKLDTFNKSGNLIENSTSGCSVSSGETCTIPRKPVVDGRSSVVNGRDPTVNYRDTIVNGRDPIVNSRYSIVNTRDPSLNSTHMLMGIKTVPSKDRVEVPTDDVLDEIKSQDGGLDANNSKRIKLEDPVLGIAEIDRTLEELENLLKFLREKKSVMNAAHRDKMNELCEVLANLVVE